MISERLIFGSLEHYGQGFIVFGKKVRLQGQGHAVK